MLAWGVPIANESVVCFLSNVRFGCPDVVEDRLIDAMCPRVDVSSSATDRLQDGDGLRVVYQQVCLETNGVVGSRMVVYQKIPVGLFGGFFIEFPKPPTIPHPTIAQGLDVTRVAWISKEHRVMVIPVLRGLLMSSRLKVLHQGDGKQIHVMRK